MKDEEFNVVTLGQRVSPSDPIMKKPVHVEMCKWK
jgi:hypothetical protein